MFYSSQVRVLTYPIIGLFPTNTTVDFNSFTNEMKSMWNMRLRRVNPRSVSKINSKKVSWTIQIGHGRRPGIFSQSSTAVFYFIFHMQLFPNWRCPSVAKIYGQFYCWFAIFPPSHLSAWLNKVNSWKLPVIRSL